MTQRTVGDVREYYRQITDIDIGGMAREILAERIVQEGDRLLQCDCPNHKSSSHRSLHILLDKQGWYCFGCGVGGDVLQLSRVRTNRARSPVASPVPCRRAIGGHGTFLAAKAQLPPLARNGLSPERLRKDRGRAGTRRARSGGTHGPGVVLPPAAQGCARGLGVADVTLRYLRRDHRYPAHRVRRQRSVQRRRQAANRRPLRPDHGREPFHPS